MSTKGISEAHEQAAVVEYCDWRHIPVFHIPNGGFRDVREAANLKRQGVRAGVPDLFIPYPSKNYHGLFIEMKRTKGGSVSPKQETWLRILNRNGYLAKVCHGAHEAVELIEDYIDG